jgi:5-methylthioadenosine/S-adenosylhomocysteine deaminase
MLLKNAQYLDENFNITTGDLHVSDGKVWTEENNDISEQAVLDCSDYVIIPGLFNAHFHGYSLTAKGLAKEKKIEEWSNNDHQGKIQQTYFERLEQLTAEEWQILCMKAYMDMARKGISFVSETEPGNWPDVVAEAINNVGIRGLVESHDKIEMYCGRKSGKVSFGAHLLEEEDITDETLELCVKSKQAYDTLFMTHCMENDWRRDLIYSKYGRSSVQLYEEKELLDSNTILFHAAHINHLDIELVAEAGSSIVHCPVSNLWSGAGIAPVALMLDKGVNVCLGTDYASTDIWEVMRVAYYLLKYNVPVDRFNAHDIFKMATHNGAKAYKQDSLGKIGNGMLADLVFIRRDELIPTVEDDGFSTIVHNLLFETQEASIHHLMVDGEWVMYDRKLTKVDEEAINIKYKEVLSKIYAFQQQLF